MAFLVPLEGPRCVLLLVLFALHVILFEEHVDGSVTTAALSNTHQLIVVPVFIIDPLGIALHEAKVVHNFLGAFFADEDAKKDHRMCA